MERPNRVQSTSSQALVWENRQRRLHVGQGKARRQFATAGGRRPPVLLDADVVEGDRRSRREDDAADADACRLHRSRTRRQGQDREHAGDGVGDALIKAQDAVLQPEDDLGHVRRAQRAHAGGEDGERDQAPVEQAALAHHGPGITHGCASGQRPQGGRSETGTYVIC